MGREFRHERLPELKWGSAVEVRESLESLFAHSVNHAEKAIQWYIDHKGRKKVGGMALRAGAIVCLAVAGILPLLTQIFVEEGSPIIAPAWASVALALGLALVGLDRFFGFSSSWMRYTQTQLRLEGLLGAFTFEWELARHSQAVASTQAAAGAADQGDLVLQSQVHVRRR
jgi:SMODS and SLOG-associating 2TM effector domain 2